jgi:hypothetical protein
LVCRRCRSNGRRRRQRGPAGASGKLRPRRRRGWPSRPLWPRAGRGTAQASTSKRCCGHSDGRRLNRT